MPRGQAPHDPCAGDVCHTTAIDAQSRRRRPVAFDPLKRASSWSSWKHKVFDYISRREMNAFGYESKRELSAFDRLAIPLYLLTWPLRALPAILYYAIKDRKLIIKTN